VVRSLVNLHVVVPQVVFRTALLERLVYQVLVLVRVSTASAVHTHHTSLSLLLLSCQVAQIGCLQDFASVCGVLGGRLVVHLRPFAPYARRQKVSFWLG